MDRARLLYFDEDVYSSDTDVTPYDGGAYASSTTYVTGNAVKNTADKLKTMILKEGAKLLDVNENMVAYDGKVIKVLGTDKLISLEELSMKMIYSSKQLTASESFVGHKSPPPYMAGFAEVEVDLGTGQISVLNFATVLDIGTVINPNLAQVQVEGGVVQGIGMALFEDVQYTEKGRLITNSFLSYKLPTRMDVGNIIVEFADSYDPSGPFGAKSVGEVVINTACPAIADAVYNATGVRITSLPLTPEKILMALRNEKNL